MKLKIYNCIRRIFLTA